MTSSSERRGSDRVQVATVLVVDDSSTIRRILRRDLEAAGYRVEEARDGEEGLAACRAVVPDLVLLDVDMPVLDGLGAMQRMQADPDLQHLPVLFLTARTGGGEAARGLELGAHDYLKKPCDQAELLARVSAALRRRDRERGLTARAAELAAISTTDSLTKLPNRRGIDELLRTFAADATLALLLVDIDHFKQINDQHGHIVGDAVLAILAARLHATSGPEATPGRWGGEEFLVLAPGQDDEGIAALGERLRTAVAGSPFAVGSLSSLSVTVSIGGTCGPTSAVEELLGVADAALYDAKSGGRDRVVVRTSAVP